MAKDVEEQFLRVQLDEAKSILLKQQTRISELKEESHFWERECKIQMLRIDKVKEWKKEAENYQYGDGLDTQEINDKLKEILK